MTSRDDLAPATLVAQGVHPADRLTGSVVPSITPSTTFARNDAYELFSEDHAYTRDDNPSYQPAEQTLRQLEGGADALLFSSGMAAASAVIQSLKPGDHLIIPGVMYWGLRNWMVEFCRRWGIGLDQFNQAEPDDLAAKIIPGKTRLVWIETPSNPTWDVIDIAAAAKAAHAAGALLAVDSTVSTPVLTRPIELGADIVMHSATKYLNGHADVLAGALVTAAKDEFWATVAGIRSEIGAIPGSVESWLLQRGMRTLFLRVLHASRSAQAIATHFQHHPKIETVLYPGLETHPGHEIARRQMSGGYGGMLSICMLGGEDAALKLARRCQVFIRATSLGGVESLIEHRYTIEGPRSPIPKNLVRVSVGIEAVDDLIADIEQALN